MGRQQIVLFLDFYDFWRENYAMNMPNFEIHKYTNLIIAFERTCKMRDITELISQLLLLNPEDMNF